MFAITYCSESTNLLFRCCSLDCGPDMLFDHLAQRFVPSLLCKGCIKRVLTGIWSAGSVRDTRWVYPNTGLPWPPQVFPHLSTRVVRRGIHWAGGQHLSHSPVSTTHGSTQSEVRYFAQLKGITIYVFHSSRFRADTVSNFTASQSCCTWGLKIGSETQSLSIF